MEECGLYCELGNIYYMILACKWHAIEAASDGRVGNSGITLY